MLVCCQLSEDKKESVKKVPNFKHRGCISLLFFLFDLRILFFYFIFKCAISYFFGLSGGSSSHPFIVWFPIFNVVCVCSKHRAGILGGWVVMQVGLDIGSLAVTITFSQSIKKGSFFLS